VNLKKPTRQSQLTSAVVQQQWHQFWSRITQESVDNLVFLDEMGIFVGIMRDMARHLKGTRADDFDGVYRGKRCLSASLFTENLREAPHLQVGEGQERQLRGVQYPRNCQV